MTLNELIENICERESWDRTAVPSGWDILVPQPRGRKQTVRATLIRTGREELVRYTSIVGSRDLVDERRARTALELNAKMPHGCLALDGEHLVLTDTRPLRTTTPETSADSIRYLAKQADMYERLIYSTDSQ